MEKSQANEENSRIMVARTRGVFDLNQQAVPIAHLLKAHAQRTRIPSSFISHSKCMFSVQTFHF